jgi:Family of unknown function (DUF6263)
MSAIYEKAVLAVLLAFAVFLAAPPVQGQVELRYKFKEGEKLPYVIEQKAKNTTNSGGQTIETQTVLTVDYTMNVLSVDKDGKANISQRIDRIRRRTDGPGGKFEYDSKDDKETDHELAKWIVPIYKAMVGSDFTMTKDARGRLGDLKLPERVKDAFKKVHGQDVEPFREDMFKRMVVEEELNLIAPEGAVMKGMTWDQKTETRLSVGKMKTENTFTYDGPTTEGKQILQKVTLKPKNTLEVDPASGFVINLKDHDAKGTALFDSQTGRLVEVRLTQNTEMELSALGQTMTLKTEEMTTLKLQEKGNPGGR